MGSHHIRNACKFHLNLILDNHLQQQLDFLIPHKGDAQEELLPGPPIEDTSAYKAIDTHTGIHAYKLTETPVAPSKSMLRHNATRSKPLSANTPTSTGFSADDCDVVFKQSFHFR